MLIRGSRIPSDPYHQSVSSGLISQSPDMGGIDETADGFARLL